MQRHDLSLERGPGAERDERDCVPPAGIDDGDDLAGGARVDDEVGKAGSVVRLAPRMLLAHRLCGDDVLGAERSDEIGCERVRRGSHGAG